MLQVDDAGVLESDGKLGLLKAALRTSGLGPCALRTRSDAPPGSGLGSSGALDVAVVGAIDASRGITRTPLELAEAAFRLGVDRSRASRWAAGSVRGGAGRLQQAGVRAKCGNRGAARAGFCIRGRARAPHRGVLHGDIACLFAHDFPCHDRLLGRKRASFGSVASPGRYCGGDGPGSAGWRPGPRSQTSEHETGSTSNDWIPR